MSLFQVNSVGLVIYKWATKEILSKRLKMLCIGLLEKNYFMRINSYKKDQNYPKRHGIFGTYFNSTSKLYIVTSETAATTLQKLCNGVWKTLYCLELHSCRTYMLLTVLAGMQLCKRSIRSWGLKQQVRLYIYSSDLSGVECQPSDLITGVRDNVSFLATLNWAVCSHNTFVLFDW